MPAICEALGLILSIEKKKKGGKEVEQYLNMSACHAIRICFLI